MAYASRLPVKPNILAVHFVSAGGHPVCARNAPKGARELHNRADHESGSAEVRRLYCDTFKATTVAEVELCALR